MEIKPAEIYFEFMSEIDKDILSKTIEWRYGRPYSHVAIRYRHLDGRWKRFHAISKGVCYQELSTYETNHEVVEAFKVRLDISERDFAFYVRGMSGPGIDRGGMEYSTSHLALIALGLDHLMVASDKMICSKVAHRVVSNFAKTLGAFNSKPEGKWRPDNFRDQLNSYRGNYAWYGVEKVEPKDLPR